ncbi:MAG TPA: rRNA maturation RNase YbeY [Peptococcaceae bacterium]|nr:MAG: Endoribonuclease YbeY [Clostridia bacterium 41_269]HBT20297.1 rRNA maturation RNase YbeY [Peptococcaceae bacterium]
MEITVNNVQQKVELSFDYEELIKKCVEEVCRREKVPDNCKVGITLMDDEGIRLLNRDFRGIDDPTDVLSFSAMERVEEEPEIFYQNDDEGPLVLGDIVISVETAARQAEEYGHTMERELSFLVVHGMLHLLGYDHEDEISEQKMFSLQRDILNHLGILR